MRIEDLIARVEYEAEKNEGLFLDIRKTEALGLITPPLKSLFQRLIKGETFIFKDLYKESNIEEKNYTEEELKYLIKDLDLSSLANHYFYSYDKNADSLLRIEKDKELYLSFLNVTYRIRDIEKTAPVFFIRVKISIDENDKINLSLVDSDPIYNRALIHKLKTDLDIDIRHPSFVFDIDNYISLIKSKDVNQLLSVTETVNLIDLPVRNQNKLWFILDNEEKIKNSPLFNILKGQYTGTKLDEEPHKSIDEVIDRFYSSLDSTYAGIITTYNEDTARYILEEITTDYLSSGKSVSIYGKGVEEIADLIKSNNLYPLIYDPRGKVNYLNRDAKESLNRNEEEVHDFNSIYDEYIKLTDERKKCFSLPFADNTVTMAHTIANYTAFGKAKYHFTLDDYSEEDIKTDKEFFKKFSTLKSLHSIPLSRHPFYGLTSRADEQTYNEMQRYIKKTLEDLSSFISKIELINVSKLGLDPIETVIDYQRLAKHFAVLKDYEGSFLPYLKMDIEDYRPDELEELINKYNSISSTRTSIDLNVQPAFWNLNLKALISDLDNKTNAKSARSQILNAQKEPDKKNFDSFVRLIKIYLENEDTISKIISNFKEIGLDVTTLDKAMEVQKAFEFKRNMISHARLYDDIDFSSNPFFIQFFTDEKMREDLKTNIIPPLQEISNQLSIDFDAMRSFFDSGEQKDYETMAFNKVRNYLTRISSASYSDYNEYFNFVLDMNHTSLPLKNVIDKLIADDDSFDYLEVDYFSSILNSYKDVVLKESKVVENDIRTFKPLWRKNLSIALDEERKKKVNATFASIKEYLNDLTYRATSREIKRYTYTYDYLHNVSMITKYSDIIKRTHPLHLLNRTDHYDRLFATDITIITNFEELNLIDLLELIAISNKLVIINKGRNIKISVDGNEVMLNSFIPETIYDLKNLFKTIDYSVIDEHLFNLLEFHANRIGYRLIKDYQVGIEKYPLVLLRPGQTTPSFVLIPDLGMVENHEDVIKVAFPILVSIYKTIPIELPLLLSSLLPKEILLFETEPVQATKLDEPALPKEEVVVDKKEEKKKAYEAKLESIRNSFTVKNSISTQEPTDEEYILSCLPISENDLSTITNETKAIFNEMVEQGKIVKINSTYYPLNKSYIVLHKDEKEKVYRQELLQGVFKYITSFTYLPKETLIEEITSILNVEKDNAFINGEINMVLHQLFKDKKIIISKDDKISLYK